MQIKRFEATDMREAMRQVKEALGPEAIILSTKTSGNRPARPDAPASLVEVVAATEHSVTERPQPARKVSPLWLHSFPAGTEVDR